MTTACPTRPGRDALLRGIRASIAPARRVIRHTPEAMRSPGQTSRREPGGTEAVSGTAVELILRALPVELLGPMSTVVRRGRQSNRSPRLKLISDRFRTRNRGPWAIVLTMQPTGPTDSVADADGLWGRPFLAATRMDDTGLDRPGWLAVPDSAMDIALGPEAGPGNRGDDPRSEDFGPPAFPTVRDAMDLFNGVTRFWLHDGIGRSGTPDPGPIAVHLRIESPANDAHPAANVAGEDLYCPWKLTAQLDVLPVRPVDRRLAPGPFGPMQDAFFEPAGAHASHHVA